MKKWPQHVEDCVSALHWVCSEEAVRMGADPSRVTFCGASAGGHIAALVMQHVQSRPSDFRTLRVMTAVLFYPALDPGDLTGVTAFLPFSIWPLWYRSRESLLAWFFKVFILKDSSLWPSADVLSNIQSGQTWPPTLVLHGERDSVVPFEHSRHFLSKLAGPHVGMRHCDALISVPGARHTFDIVGDAKSTAVYEGVVTWLETQLKESLNSEGQECNSEGQQ